MLNSGISHSLLKEMRNDIALSSKVNNASDSWVKIEPLCQEIYFYLKLLE